MNKVILGRISVDKDKVWGDTEVRLAKIREEVTYLLFECGHSINKQLVEDVSTIVYNREINAFYKTNLGDL